jgi:hypothetical protein
VIARSEQFMQSYVVLLVTLLGSSTSFAAAPFVDGDTPVLQTFDRIFQGDDPSESFKFSQTFDPAVRATIRFSGFAENLSTFDETGARFFVGWGQAENDLEEGILFPEGPANDMGVRFPPADPLLGPVRVPLEIVAKTDYWPASLRFDVEGLGCCDHFRLVGTLTIEPTPEPELRISRLGGAAARIMWTTNSAGYVLECATNLPAVTWSAVTNSISTAGTTFSVTVNTDEPFKVFRLSKLLSTD